MERLVHVIVQNVNFQHDIDLFLDWLYHFVERISFHNRVYQKELVERSKIDNEINGTKLQ